LIAESSHKKKLQIYRENIELLQHYQIIHVDEKNGKDNVKRMSDILSIDRKYLFSPFYSDKLFIINLRYILGDSIIRYFYDILLDTQIVSYIDRKDSETNELIKDIVMKIGKNRQVKSSASISLYMNENCLFSKKLSERVLENIKSFFIYMYLGHSKYKWLAKLRAKSAVKRIIKNQEIIFNHPFNERMKKQYMLIYILLMKICIISLDKKETRKKVTELMDFQSYHLKAIDIGLTEIAIAYFRLKQKLSFFGKIQKGRTDLIDTVKNMAWDLFHLRFQNLSTGLPHIKGADVTLSLMCSIDKRLLEIRKYMRLKMLAYDKRNFNIFPFYEKDELKKTLSKDEIIKYFSGDEHYRRLEEKAKLDLDLLASEVENEFINIFYFHKWKHKVVKK
ncbi:MAG: hypothetical protein M0R03_20520, partial [Novosphingobium sp.]|nr:hypothetical protein [Novosphingobium sp.]